MASWDIFEQDPFSLVNMTDSVNKMLHVPGRIGALGLFTPRPSMHRTIAIEERQGFLKLIQTSQPCGPSEQWARRQRLMRPFVIPHVSVEDYIPACELIDVRAFGTESAPESMQIVINERMGEMVASMDATLENLRLGAIKGQILDADGSLLFDLFAEFGVTPLPDVSTDFSSLTAGTGTFKKQLSEAIRDVSDELGAVNVGQFHVMCGRTYFDNLVSNPETHEAYDRLQDSQLFRTSQVFDMFRYGGVTFEDYRGSIGGTPLIADDEAYLFPVGVPNLFMNYFAPADFVDTVNTMGLPRYARVWRDPKQRWVELHTQMNPLPLCLRPRVLRKLVDTTP